MPSPSESDEDPSLGSFGNGSLASSVPSPSVSVEFGFVPNWNSSRFVRPSPSGSAPLSAAEFGFRPYPTSQPSDIPSLSVSGLFISVPAFCSCALVRPSPSQSAPPSDGSRGSDPSALTPVEPAIITRIMATITLLFFVFIVSSLPKIISFSPNSPKNKDGVFL